jgi:hypothetical protein
METNNDILFQDTTQVNLYQNIAKFKTFIPEILEQTPIPHFDLTLEGH